MVSVAKRSHRALKGKFVSHSYVSHTLVFRSRNDLSTRRTYRSKEPYLIYYCLISILRSRTRILNNIDINRTTSGFANAWVSSPFPLLNYTILHWSLQELMTVLCSTFDVIGALKTNKNCATHFHEKLVVALQKSSIRLYTMRPFYMNEWSSRR